MGPALSYRDLTDEIPPPAVHLADAEGSHRLTIDYPPTIAHVFRAATFALGQPRPKLARLTDIACGLRAPSSELYSGVRIVVSASIDRARHPLRIDINFGDPVIPGPIEIDFPAPLDEPFSLPACRCRKHDRGVSGRSRSGGGWYSMSSTSSLYRRREWTSVGLRGGKS